MAGGTNGQTFGALCCNSSSSGSFNKSGYFDKYDFVSSEVLKLFISMNFNGALCS